jgi:hypothetical protein
MIKKAQKISFFHGSKNEFPIGFILTPQRKNGYVHQEKASENIVEKYRPVDKISRFESVFLVDEPSLIDYAGGYDDFVYQVAPIGQLDKSDLCWYTEMFLYLVAPAEEQEIVAVNYWNGLPYNKPASILWEYRARSAKIIKVL